ncbi:MAG: acyl carrier protein [Pirellulales bacterium]
MDVDWTKLGATFVGTVPSFLGELVSKKKSESKGENKLRNEVLALPADKRHGLLENYFRAQLARVMELDAEKIDTQQPLNSLGLDSLMVIELKNVIESSLEVTIPMSRFLEGPSLSQLAGYAPGSHGRPDGHRQRVRRADGRTDCHLAACDGDRIRPHGARNRRRTVDPADGPAARFRTGINLGRPHDACGP